MPGDFVSSLVDRMSKKKGSEGGSAKREAMQGLIDAIHAKDAEAALDWRDRLADCESAESTGETDVDES
jgi:hypothetical protein